MLRSAVIGFLFALGVVHLLLFLFLRRPAANLHFAIFAVIMAAGQAAAVLGPASGSYRWSDRLFFWVVVPARWLALSALVGFLYAVFHDRIPRRRFLAAWGAMLATVAFFEFFIWHVALQPPWTRRAIGIAALLLIAEGVRTLIVALWRRKEGAWVIAPGSAAFFGVVGASFFNLAFGRSGPNAGNWVIFGFLAVALSASVYLSRNFARTTRGFEELSRELERTNDGLEQKVAERTADLAEARAVAESANETKSQFLANMSHELRTPLNAIIGYSEMLVEEAEDLSGVECVPDLEKIHAAGKHLLGLINAVLDISKVEAGRMDLYLEAFSVEELVREVAGTVAPLIEQQANELALRLPPGLGDMRADSVKLRQILLNLLSNSSKFTERGTVSLSAERGRDADGEEWLVFEVVDSGIGMSTEQMAMLFQPFVQVDAGAARQHGGTGLGLTISKRFAEMMGGSVGVRSEVGVGTTFTVRIPARVADLPRPVQLQPETAARLSASAPVPATEPATDARATVLVVDDDAAAREVIRRILSGEGYRVLEAATGADGVELARRERPDIITLDVLLPGQDGWSVLGTLKSDEALRRIPVVMMTMVDDQPLGYALGAVDYLVKPVDRVQLRDVLQRHLAGPRAGGILVVDDDAATREMISRTLEREGWPVRQAANGREALAAVEDSRPDLILLDLIMPEMDGFEFLDAVRGAARPFTTPVVVVTSKDLTPEERERLRGGVERVIQKGTQPREEMVAEVRRLLLRVGGAEAVVA